MSDQQSSVLEIVGAVIDLPEPERTTELLRLCAGDEALARKVEALIRSFHQTPDSFLAAADLGRLIEGYAHDLDRMKAPHDIKAPGYDVHEKLGEGGAGIVYRATHEKTAQERALKLFYPGPAGVRRCDVERRILASVGKRTGTVKYLDYGVAQTLIGECPFLVVDLIKGDPIDKYVEKHGLSTRAIADLVLRTCVVLAGVHRDEVSHCDLKPSHILVSDEGEAPHTTPRITLIDFGIGRGRLGLADPVTWGGTPGYMSPEQIKDAVAGASMQSDIYALGVILWELIEKRDPLELDEVDSRSDGAFKALSGLFSGDIVTIFTRATAPIDRRYGQVSEMAADLRSFVLRRPVESRQGRWPYRTGKFIVRRPALAGLIAASCCVGIAGAALGAKEHQLRTQQQAESDRADKTQRFVLSIFEPSSDPGGIPTEVSLAALKRAGLRAPTHFGADLVGAARARWALGCSLFGAGDTLGAIAELRQAESTFAAEMGPDARELLFLRTDLMVALGDAGLFDEAEAMGRDTLRRLINLVGPGHDRTANCILNLASILADSRHGELAEPFIVELLEWIARNPPADAWFADDVRSTYASVLEATGELERAEETARKAAASLATILGPSDPRTLRAKANLGVILGKRDSWKEAEALISDAYAARAQVLGPSHPRTLLTRINLAVARLRRGGELMAAPETRPEGRGMVRDAETLCREAIAYLRGMPGSSKAILYWALDTLGSSLFVQNRLEESRAALQEAYEGRLGLLGADHPDTNRSHQNLMDVKAFIK